MQGKLWAENLRGHLSRPCWCLAGGLNFHRREDIELNPGSQDSWIVTHCELITISMGHAKKRDEVPELPQALSNDEERTEPFERYEYYNVLWIEWEDGIAYRKGVGRVEKGMWEAQPLE